MTLSFSIFVLLAIIGLVCWLGLLTYHVWKYRAAIIKLQREISDTGGILDELTRPVKLVRKAR